MSCSKEHVLRRRLRINIIHLATEQMLGCFVEPCAPEDSEQADETGPLIGHHYTVALHIFLQVFLLKEPFIGMTIGDLPMHKIVGVNDADVSLYVRIF